jgi:hypothetical protein
MIRLAALTAGVALLLSTGCTHEGEWSVRKALGWDDPPGRSVTAGKGPVALTSADLEVQARAENLGHLIVARNTFIGIDPVFRVLGVKESVLFHVGTGQLLISQGLVEKCQTDAELAAVLCSELGQMVTEKRAALAVRRDVEPIPEAVTTNALSPGGGAFDAGQQVGLAMHERKFPKNGSRLDALDSVASARELLQGAGYSSAELDRVDALLKLDPRNEQLRKQMGGSAPSPRWDK